MHKFQINYKPFINHLKANYKPIIEHSRFPRRDNTHKYWSSGTGRQCGGECNRLCCVVCSLLLTLSAGLSWTCDLVWRGRVSSHVINTWGEVGCHVGYHVGYHVRLFIRCICSSMRLYTIIYVYIMVTGEQI